MLNTLRGQRAQRTLTAASVLVGLLLLGGCATAHLDAPVVQSADEVSAVGPPATEPNAPATISPVTTAAPASAVSLPDGTVAITWAPCDAAVIDRAGIDTQLVECGSLGVPLDYTKPEGTKIQVALMRYPTSGGAKRIGSLLLNPGGPGGSGIEFLGGLLAQKESKIADLHDRFDMIGFDPRGVDASNGLACVDGATLDKQFQVDITPETPEEKAFAKSLDETITAACNTKYGEAFLTQINTEATARDMDQIRAAVGDDKLSYLGISYGTYLGAVYATLFPDRVRALVLDGAFDPVGEDELTGNLIQMKGFEGAFSNWMSWCATSAVCAFGPTNVEQRWLALRQGLDDKPIKGDDTRTVNQGTFISATIAALYEKSQGWPALGAALKSAEDGDGSLLLQLADSQSGRRDDGTYDSLSTAFGIISCTSGLAGTPPADKAGAATQLQAASPHFSFSASAEDFNSCEGLPVGVAKPFAYSGSGPILVIGGKNDPATPFAWAVKMAKELGPKATLISYAGEGHSTWLESDCTDAAISAVLLKAVAVAPQDCPAQASTQGLPDWMKALPPTPNAAAANVDDLAPLLGLEEAKLQGRVVLSTDAKAAAAKAVEKSLVAAGWKSLGGQNSTRQFGRTVNGQVLQLLVVPVALSELASGSPFTEVIADHLGSLGKTVIIYGTPIE